MYNIDTFLMLEYSYFYKICEIIFLLLDLKVA